VAATALWSTPDVDVLYAGIADGAELFKASRLDGWSRSFDHSRVVRDLAAGKATDADLEGLGATPPLTLGPRGRTGSPLAP
jgi:hypothetical protein